MIDFQGDEIHFQEVNHAVRFGLVQAAVFSHFIKTAAATKRADRPAPEPMAVRLRQWAPPLGALTVTLLALAVVSKNFPAVELSGKSKVDRQFLSPTGRDVEDWSRKVDVLSAGLAAAQANLAKLVQRQLHGAIGSQSLSELPKATSPAATVRKHPYHMTLASCDEARCSPSV